ncbi:flagellar motor protein MotB [Desulfosporosinus sp. BICA1-9]|uniref:flagellar motor protein MotB n=1 Tax=Desulfosporosinus sp. BICA1-9 TaxID=1531958 RepID=UPI00054BABEE|nr:flagellar motor protein MotB [Desulfosporosinus sp. BICA1-9]KJS50246.1 MAG: flagellar motor protein [Peptococcaceae bacterium BRH_c23]KJS86782.1 MAG: flagellar motor protein [Desulfosporosinus sp. BICA1-9]HBW36490.1 flagellar motor protein [Desulfosporosinus sp.]
MRRKRKHEAEKENGERWLLTYADLITLLMIFFVVLYSMSKVDAERFQAVAESLNKALGGGTPAKIELATSPVGPSLIQTGTPSPRTTHTNSNTNEETKNTTQENTDAENMSIEAIKAKLDKFAADNQIQSKLVSSLEERGLVVSIQETLLFESGSASINDRARDILEKISTVLAPTPNQIRVEGHTDNLPIRTPQFPSNWELSVIRATNVVQILLNDQIIPSRLSATGYGEYRPISPNDTDTGRSKNRRIDLIILRSKYDLTEPSAPTPISDPLTKQ